MPSDTASLLLIAHACECRYRYCRSLSFQFPSVFSFSLLNWRNPLFLGCFPRFISQHAFSSSTFVQHATDWIDNRVSLQGVYGCAPEERTKDIPPRPSRVFMCELDQAIILACFKPYYIPACFTLSERVSHPNFPYIDFLQRGRSEQQEPYVGI